MTIRYVDLENGNDANDGSSFANRKKTIGSADTGLTAGDEIRVMASPSPVSMGINATFTKGSETVTLASAVTANIDTCDAAWTGAANVTASASSNRREGSNSASLVIAGAFTTGLIAYHALGGSVDFSGYKQVSLLMRTSAAIGAGVLQLKLCSDAAGATPVNTITLPALSVANHWSPVVVDTGAALGSAIQSVALYAASDPNGVTLLLDNIVACKDSTAADALTHMSLFGKNSGDDEPWMCVGTVNGTTLIPAIGNWGVANKGSNAAKYYGTSETVAIYRREAIRLSNWDAVNVSGTYLGQLTIRGGYNRTDMSTRDDYTCLRPTHAGNSDSLIGSASASYTTFDRFILAGVSTAANGLQFFNGVANRLGACGFSACSKAVGFQGSTFGGSDGALWAVGCGSAVYLSSTVNGIYDFEFGKVWGLGNVSGVIAFCEEASSGYKPIVKVYCPEACNFSGLIGGTPNMGPRWEVYDTAFTDVASLDNFTDVPEIRTFDVGAYTLQGLNADIKDTNYGKSAGALRVLPRIPFSYSGRIETATDQRHTASGTSWKFFNETTIGLNTPAVLPLERVFCPASEARTVTLWVRRSHANIAVRLTAVPECAPSFVSITPDDASAAINTWEQLSISFTPSIDAEVEIQAHCYHVGAVPSGNNAWADDLEVT